MKHLIILSLIFYFSISSMFGQTKTYKRFTQAIQIDSSNYFIIASLADEKDTVYRVKNEYTHSITNTSEIWTNIFIYNRATEEKIKLFPDSLMSVFKVMKGLISGANFGTGQTFMFSTILKNHLLFLIQNDYNKDVIINTYDPIYLFISSISGKNIVPVTPKGMNLTSWSISQDGKTIFVQLQQDKNGDKNFYGEDENLYKIELDPNIAKIKMVAVKL